MLSLFANDICKYYNYYTRKSQGIYKNKAKLQELIRKFSKFAGYSIPGEQNYRAAQK
jgi:hypothetical protein